MESEFNINELLKAIVTNNFAYISKYLPQKIYKYRDFKNVYNVTNIKKHQIRLTDPKLFNDPYDSSLSYFVPLDTQIPQNVIETYKKAKNNSSFGLDKKYIDKISKIKTVKDLIEFNISEMKISLTKFSEILEYLNNYITQVVNDSFTSSSLRICSFTVDNDNLLMWSHYADEHKGFCIEYDISDFRTCLDFRNRLYPVIYTSELFKPQNYDFKKDEFWALELIASLFKAVEWSYEKEFRYIEPGGIDNDFYKMPKPSAIYFGSRYDKNDGESMKNVQDLIKTSDELGIKKYKMKLSNQKYKMKAEDF